MRRALKKEAPPQVEFVTDLPPRKGGGSGKWADLLLPMLKNPGRWALIHTAETPEQANKTQSNLHARMVSIPEPTHDWQFAARGCEVFAIYRGRKRGKDASVRRANRRG